MSAPRKRERPKAPQKLHAAAEYGTLYEQYLAEEPKEKKKAAAKKGWYLKLCEMAPKGKPAYSSENLRAAIDFLGWDVKPEQVNGAPMLMLVLTLIPCIFALIYLLMPGIIPFLPKLRLDFMLVMYIAPVLVLVPFVAMWYVQKYPLKAADAEKMRSLTYIPEIINYIVMSMKLTPNLERAVEFAAEHGRGKIADDFKKLAWDIKVGTYRTVEEGLDQMAYKWGRYSDEFKHALMLIRSSVIEVDEAKRAAILDKAVAETLEGIRDSMDKYAVQMRQPSIYLYYVGVLLPLMMIIMLPIGSVMAKLPLANTFVMVLLYNIGIPLGTVFFASMILTKRPPVYVPPQIPDTYPGLPPKGHVKLGGSSMPAILLAAGAAIIVYLAFSMVLEPIINPTPETWKKEAAAAWYPFFNVAGAVVAACIALSIYLYGSAYAKRKVQKDIMVMEREFQDSVYVIASRLGENRPMEEAIGYSAEFLAGTKISVVFKKAAENIQTLGMTVEMALFDPIYGALKDVPSDLIRGSMRIVIDSISLGVQQGARALISLSLQLRDSQKVKDKIASMLEEITSMMKSIAFMIGPIVLGVTTALQKIVISALKAAGSTAPTAQNMPSNLNINVPSMPLSALSDTTALESIPDSVTFLLIMAIYVIEVTIILIYFTSKIEEGENPLAFRMTLATSLPLAIGLFFMSAWFAAGMAVVGG